MKNSIQSLYNLYYSQQGTINRKTYIFGVLGQILSIIMIFLVPILIFAILSGDNFNYSYKSSEVSAINIFMGTMSFLITASIIIFLFIIPNFCLTMKRVRDIGWPSWTMCFNYCPLIQGCFMILMVGIPSRELLASSHP